VASLREVQRRAAVYVCDNSSSMYEFAATGRPVVVLDLPEGRIKGIGYRRNINHGLRFWDALFGATAFVYVFAIGSLLAGPVCGAVAVLLLFVGIAGSGASDVPSAAGVSKDVQEGDFISFTPSGATGSNIPEQFVAVIRQ
jgi:hypothetical protein